MAKEKKNEELFSATPDVAPASPNNEFEDPPRRRFSRPFERLLKGLMGHATDPTLEPEDLIKEFQVLLFWDSKSDSEALWFFNDPSLVPARNNYKCQCKKPYLRYLFFMINMKKKDSEPFIVGKSSFFILMHKSKFPMYTYNSFLQVQPASKLGTNKRRSIRFEKRIASLLDRNSSVG